MDSREAGIFSEFGALPPGFSNWQFEDLLERLSFSKKRRDLLKSLQWFLADSHIAKSAHELWIDGSFVENEHEPDDIDILLVMYRKNVSAEAKIEVNQYSRAGNRAKLYNERGIDLNWCIAEDDLFGLDWYESFFSMRAGNMANYKKGIIKIAL